MAWPPGTAGVGLLSKIDRIEFREYTSNRVGLGGLDASDATHWVNVLDGQPQSAHRITSHAAKHPQS